MRDWQFPHSRRFSLEIGRLLPESHNWLEPFLLATKRSASMHNDKRQTQPAGDETVVIGALIAAFAQPPCRRAGKRYLDSINPMRLRREI